MADTTEVAAEVAEVVVDEEDAVDAADVAIITDVTAVVAVTVVITEISLQANRTATRLPARPAWNAREVAVQVARAEARAAAARSTE